MIARNIPKLYLFSFFWMFLILMPIIVPFFSGLGLSMHEIFQLQAVFAVGVVIFEVPTGYICDLFGRKKSLLIGAAFNGIGFSLLNFQLSFAGLVVFELLLALAMSFVSGADVSLLYDSNKGESRERSTSGLANMQLASMAGESIAALLSIYLITISFTAVIKVNAFVAWLPLLIGLTIQEPAYAKMSVSSHRENFHSVFQHIFRAKDRILILAFLNWTAWGLATFFAVWMFQRYWAESGIPLTQFGLIWAAYNITTGVVGTQVHRLENKFGPTPLLIFLGLAPVCAYFGMGLLEGAIGVAFGLFFYISRGINQVLLKDAVNWRTPSEFRATVNSVQSLCFRLTFAVLGPGVGLMIDKYGIHNALLVMGAVFFIGFLFLMLPLIAVVRKNIPGVIPSR